MFKHFNMFLILTLVVLVSGGAVPGCGGGSGGLDGASLVPAIDNIEPPVARAVADVLAELDALEAPAEVDKGLFAELKAELKRVLVAKGVQAIPITPPMGEYNKVTDLEAVYPGGGACQLEWTYVNTGDYNQDKLVSINDITPIGAYWHVKEGDANWDKAEVANGSGDTVVNITDLTQIGQNFNTRTSNYRVQRSDTGEAPWTIIATVDFGDPGGDPRKCFTYVFSAPDEAYFRVVPTDGTAEGEPSNVVSTSPEGTPAVLSVAPQSGPSGALVAFSATVEGDEPLAYAWDFGGGAAPGTSADAAPEVTLGAPGIYYASLGLSNSLGTDDFSFTLIVMGSGGPEITDVQPQSGAPGADVVFTATYTATGTPSFAWDFGGGATPNTSTDAEPEVTLGAAGDYDASLMITDVTGSDTYDFTLAVSVLPGPAIYNVNPSIGVLGETVTFTVDYTSYGTPSFSWDFGGWATPSTSTQESPMVLLGYEGLESGEVEITDEYGSDTFFFAFNVYETSDPAEIISLEPRWGVTGEEYMPVATVSGATPIGYTWDFGGGATPNTSSFASPTVTLGAPGVYSASLEVRNGLGSDSLEFALYVSDSGGLDDIILAIPQCYDTFPGRTVPVSVECFDTASPFLSLQGVRVTFNEDCEYSTFSFNAGASGGESDGIDGPIWGAIAPTELTIPDEGDMGIEVDLGGGRWAVDFWIHPVGGSETTAATGELFTFGLHIDYGCADGDQITVGIDRLDASIASRTYYCEADSTEHFWADDDNASIPPIEVCKPVFTLIDPPATGDGTAANPYPVTGGQQMHYTVATTKWGDVTTDPRTTYHLTPPGSGTVSGGVLTVDNDYQGILALQIDFDGYHSRWWHFEKPMSYVFGPDAIIAVPSKTQVAAGEAVGITIFTSQAANPFKFMNGAGVTMETGNDYVPETFNVGSPGGARDDSDGVWLDLGSTIFLIPPDWMIQATDIGGGCQRIDFNVTPIDGTDITSATGAMFYFEIEIHSDVTLGFQQFSGVERTFYSDTPGNSYHWGDLDNSHPGVPNSITMIPPP